MFLNLSNASGIVAGFMNKDSELIGNSIKDVIVEPARQHLIPGFTKVKENALKAGALGCNNQWSRTINDCICKKIF